MSIIQRLARRAVKIWRQTALGKVNKSDNPIRWGVIGLGYMAETFSCAIDGNKDGVVYAVASRSLEKAIAFAACHGKCKAYGSYEEMVGNKDLRLDIVYIATPVKYHYEHIKLCLESGLNVLCEKPITSTLQQLNELIEIAKKNNCFLMEGMWMKCLPTFQKAVEWINQGRIGDIQLVKVDFYKRELIREECTIYNAQNGGGVLRDYGVYAIAFMEYFLDGVPDSISAHKRISSHGIDSDWSITASNHEILSTINISSNFGSLSKAAIIGTKGFIEWESQFNRTNCIAIYDENGKRLDKYIASYKYEGFEYEIDEVQTCIRHNQKESSIATLKGSRNTIEIIDKLLKNEK